MSSNSEYDYRRDWPEAERHQWTGVMGAIYHNPTTGVVRVCMSGEWPDTAIVTQDACVVQRTVSGRLMQFDVHGLYWD